MIRWLLFTLLRLLGTEVVSIGNFDTNKFTEEFIISTLRRKGFVEINGKGKQDMWLYRFTCVKIERNKDAKTIRRVFIFHDIDSTNDKPMTEIKSRVTDLNIYLDYFNKL